MTDENSHQEEHEEEPEEEHESEPDLVIDADGNAWFRDAEGKLHKSEYKNTGDRELDALWKLPMDRLDDIAEDRNHPLHDKAIAVINEASRPYLEALELVGKSWTNVISPAIFETLSFTAYEVLEPAVKQLSRTFSRGFLGWIPELMRYSSAAQIARELSEASVDRWREGPPLQHDRQESLPQIEEALPAASSQFSDLVDEHAEDLPAPSAHLIKSFGQNTLRLLERGVEQQAQARRENRKAALDATKWARKANRKSAWAIVLAALTLGATVLGICVSLFDWKL